MRDQQLMRREGAGIVLVDIGLGAKKSDLKAERLAILGGRRIIKKNTCAFS